MARGRPPLNLLTDSQARVLHELELWIARCGGSPTIRELAEQTGMSAPSVDEQLRRLQRNGYVKREPFKSRSLVVLRSADTLREHTTRLVAVPIVGTVAAGYPVLATENISGEVLVDEAILRSGQHFALKASGKSMVNAGIEPKDILIVRQQQLAQHRDIVVALLNDEATVKRLIFQADAIELHPANPHFKPIQVSPHDDLRILGKVVAIQRPTGQRSTGKVGRLMGRDEDRAETIRGLRQLCGKVAYPVDSARLSLGIPALDALLAQGGLERGSLVEWVSPVLGGGAAILALQGVRLALEHHRVWAVVDPAGEFHPPAARGWGIPLESLLLLRPPSVADAFWAVEQCLRCPAVGVTWFQAETLPDRVVQRWKRAAEIGGGVGVLFCTNRALGRASWADVRWQVQRRTAAGTADRIVRVELVSCRGCLTGGSVDLELHDATGHVRLVSGMASTTASVRAAEP